MGFLLLRAAGLAAIVLTLVCDPAATVAAPVDLLLDGSVESAGGDYELIAFEVPEGSVEIEVTHATLTDNTVLDWGLWGPDGFRGWGGGLQDNAIVGELAATRGYIPGAVEAGTWHVVIGKARMGDSADYTLRVAARDVATLSPRARGQVELGAVATGQRWYAGDFHVHSDESGDAHAPMTEVAALARERGLDFVALSDHNTVSQHALAAVLDDPVLFIRAAEVTTYGGHANAFGISSYVDHRVGLDGRTAAHIAEDTAAQGGALSINHPALELGGLCIGCAWVHDDTPWELVSAVEIHTASYDLAGLFTPRAIEFWDQRLDDGYRMAALGGSDDHRAGVDLEATGSPIGSPTTLVYADELSEPAILGGVRAGRTIVKLRGPNDPMVELTASFDGTEAMLGDTITGHRIALRARVNGEADGMTLGLIRNGAPVEGEIVNGSEFETTWEIDVGAAGDRFRVQLESGGTPVVVTSHIYAQPGDAPPSAGCSAAGDAGSGNLMFYFMVLALIVGKRVRRQTRR